MERDFLGREPARSEVQTHSTGTLLREYRRQRAFLEIGVYARGRRARGTERCFKGEESWFQIMTQSHFCFMSAKAGRAKGGVRDVLVVSHLVRGEGSGVGFLLAWW